MVANKWNFCYAFNKKKVIWSFCMNRYTILSVCSRNISFSEKFLWNFFNKNWSVVDLLPSIKYHIPIRSKKIFDKLFLEIIYEAQIQRFLVDSSRIDGYIL